MQMKYSWENLAKHNHPMPEGLSSAEQKAYQSLAILSERYRLGCLTPAQAIEERRSIDIAFEHDSSADKANKWVVGLRKRIEIAHARYRKDRTIENADILSDVINGFIREVDDD